VAGSSAITVSGTVISLDPGGQSVVIGGTIKPATAAWVHILTSHLFW
jgi:hypothetical protein